MSVALVTIMFIRANVKHRNVFDFCRDDRPAPDVVRSTMAWAYGEPRPPDQVGELFRQKAGFLAARRRSHIENSYYQAYALVAKVFSVLCLSVHMAIRTSMG